MVVEDLERYLNEIVDPTIEELANRRTSVRHTFLACVAVFHAVDYLAYPRKPRTLRKQFNEESKAFAIVDDMAHAFKHVVAGNPAKPDLVAKDVITRPPAYFGTAVWDLSRWDDAHGGVTINRDTSIDLYDTVVEAAAFMRGKLKRE